MRNKLDLDYFRGNDLGVSICIIRHNENSLQLPFLFNDFFYKTTLEFIKELNTFENSSNVPTAFNISLLTIFATYFACLEQFISTVYTMLYYYKETSALLDEKSSLKIFRRDYNITINEIIKIGEIDKLDYQQTGLIKKIEELEDTRNYILHGNMGRIKTGKTNLPKYPLTINYEDVLEEIDIIINFINYFRFIFPDIDLMPSIYIHIGDGMLSKKLDDCFYNVIVPYMKDILQKHNLRETKRYELATKSISPIKKSLANKIDVYIKVEPDTQYKLELNNLETKYWFKNIKNIVSATEAKNIQGNIQLPNFIINKESQCN